MRSLIAGICILSVWSAAEAKDGPLEKDVKAVLTAQAKAWNNGDIKGYMAHYWKSEKLTFSSGGSTTRGWKATLARYEKKYPTPEKMGQLTFSQLEVTPLAKTAVLVLGRWHLKRKKDQLGGNFSIILRKLKGKWVVVHDHTSLEKK